MNRWRRSTVATALVLMAPTIAHAQVPTRPPRVGVLSPGAPPRPGDVDAFTGGMRDLGYVEEKTVVIERRYADGRLEQLPGMAAELVRLPVDVVVVQGPAPLAAAISATNRIPIVMVGSSADPVGEGLVSSLARPGGNLTGLTYAVSTDRFGKQLELLKEAVPGIRRVAVWWDAEIALFERTIHAPLRTAAGQLGLQVLYPVPVLDRQGIDDAFAAMKRQRADALFVLIAGPTNTYRQLVAEAALRHRLPTVSAFSTFVRSGGMLSYGPSLEDIQRRAAGFVDRILKGAPAGQLPIELPAKHVLAVNTKTFSALGLTLPRAILLRADEVIE